MTRKSKKKMFPAVPRKTISRYRQQEYDLLKSAVSGEILEGEDTGLFEEELRSYVGTSHAVAAASGRAALHIILQCLEPRPETGDEVIIPAYTFQAVPEIAAAAGMKPVFVDIDPETLNMDPDLLEEKITDRTRAIVATHIMGQPCDIEKIVAIADRCGAVVIEDCAESPGAQVGDRKTGSFGKAGFFSFETVKPLSTFGGGMIVTDDDALARRAGGMVSALPFPPMKKILAKIASSYVESAASGPVLFPLLVHPLLRVADRRAGGIEGLTALYKKGKKSFKSFLFKYTNLQARAGRMQLRMLDMGNWRRRQNALLLRGLLADSIRVQKELPGTTGVYYIFSVRAQAAEKAAAALLARGIDTGRNVLPDCPPLFGDRGKYPASGDAAETVLQIPVFDVMDEDTVRSMAAVINEVIG
ncbi:MAG: aminotransferase class I/II-fold pyridoxal phosphate-dependent enzyme [Pseudomonadota bacterium]